VKKLPRLCLCLALACAAAPGYDFAGLKPQGYVSDFAGVVDAGSRAQLERYAKRLEEATGVQLALVTLPTLAGEPLEEVANVLFRKWGIGHKERNDGLLLLLVPRDRRFRLEVGYGLEPIIPDGYAGSVLRAMGPALRTGNYGEALREAAHDLGSRIAQAKRVALEPAPVRRRPPRKESPIPLLALLGGVMVFAVLSGLRGSRRAYRGSGGGWLLPLIAGAIVGRTWGSSRGGGGFGGFDSSDSFGGFGGGDSGGGGASGSW
jgi:uncharacterized protein